MLIFFGWRQEYGYQLKSTGPYIPIRIRLPVFFKIPHSLQSLQCIFRAFWVRIDTDSNYLDCANKNYLGKITGWSLGRGLCSHPRDNEVLKTFD